ncbi:peptidoglycan-binding protein [Streptomyces sp. NPDC050485]|uniref:peptidoglycan-binding protein n=1 Tax=Streptomyces sp. NPDC050485 TaxID=3365617 RepID=UPI003790A941
MSVDDRTETLPAVRDDGEREALSVMSEDATMGRSRAPHRDSRKRWLIGAAVVGVLAVTAGGTAYTWMRTGSDSAPAAGPTTAGTAEVTRADLSQQKSEAGTLGFATPGTVKGHGTGTVTWLPKTGDNLAQGKQLARINDWPVTVFIGAIPLYRTLGALPDQPSGPAATPESSKDSDGAKDPNSSGSPKDAKDSGSSGRPNGGKGSGSSTDSGDAGSAGSPGSGASGSGSPTDSEVAGPGTQGADVRLLEDNLYALGYRDFGRPDDRLTDATVVAIKRWQKALGMRKPTGRVAPGDVQVLPGTSRVGEVKAHLGDSAGEDLMTLTGTDKVVTVPIPVSDLSIAHKGSQVTITLPDGSTAKGKVTQVGTVATGSDDQGGSGGGKGAQGGPGQEAKVQVTVAFDKASEAGDLAGAPVSVDFASEVHKNVLTVPVGALVALREGGYALQLPAPPGQAKGGAPQLVQVTTGMFAKGLVEVSGPGVKEGMKVVSTS